jgi:hypothetical protein
LVVFSVGKPQLKRLKRLTSQPFPDRIGVHGKSPLSRARKDLNTTIIISPTANDFEGGRLGAEQVERIAARVT